MSVYEWMAKSCPSGGVILTHTVDDKEVTFRMYFETWPLSQMLKKAARNQSQKSCDGPIEVQLCPGDMTGYGRVTK